MSYSRKQTLSSFWFDPICNGSKLDRLRFLGGQQESKLVAGHSQMPVYPYSGMLWSAVRILPLNDVVAASKLVDVLCTGPRTHQEKIAAAGLS